MRHAVCDARAVRLARGLPLIVLAVVSLLFQDAAVQPQTIKLDVRRAGAHGRVRSLLQTAIYSPTFAGGAEDRADDRGEPDGAVPVAPELVPDLDDVPVLEDVPLSDEAPGLEDAIPDDAGDDITDDLNDDVNADVKNVKRVLANPRSYEFWEDTGICVVLMCLSSCISGLSSGVLSVDVMQLELYLNGAGTKDQQRWAEQLWPVVSSGHWFLASVSIMNSMANVALPLFLDQILDTTVTFAVSVPLVVLFGEILPAAWFNAEHKLKLSAGLAPIALVIMCITFPLSYPLGRLLDVLIGNDHYHNRRYSRQELMTLVQIHQVNKFAGPSTPLLSRMNSAIGGSSAPLPAEGVLHAREAALINHAMGLTTTTSRELLTPLAHVQSLPITAFMNAAAIADLVASGHGHVPVFVDQPHNVQYYFSLQRLLLVDHRKAPALGSLKLRRPLVLHSDATLMDILYDFQLHKTKFALVSKDPAAVQAAWAAGRALLPGALEGIITSTDVLDQLIGEHLAEGYDEDDGAESLATEYRTFAEGSSASSNEGNKTDEDKSKLEVHQSNLTNEKIKASLLERALSRFSAPLRSKKKPSSARRRPRVVPRGGTKESVQPLLGALLEEKESTSEMEGSPRPKAAADLSTHAIAKEVVSSEEESVGKSHGENSEDGDVEDDDGSDGAASVDQA